MDVELNRTPGAVSANLTWIAEPSRDGFAANRTDSQNILSMHEKSHGELFRSTAKHVNAEQFWTTLIIMSQEFIHDLFIIIPHIQ